MSVTKDDFQADIKQQRWNQTLEAMKSVTQGKVTSADKVHNWLKSWGSDNEQNAPRKQQAF